MSSAESFMMMLPQSIPPADRAALGLVVEALAHARTKHPRNYQARHHFYGVLAEEVDELWEEIKKDSPLECMSSEPLGQD